MEQASKGTAKNMQDIDEDSDYSNTKEETNALGLETSPKKIDHGDRRDEIWDVSVSPDGEKIVSVSNDQIVKVWMISTGKCVLTLHGHQGMVCSVTCLCSSNGEWIGSGGSDTTVKLWRMSTGECVLTIRGHEDWVGCMTISADGEKIVSGSRDKTVKVWNFSTGECLSTLVHQGGVTGVSLSADGQRIVSCCNGAVKVWRMSTGECLSTLEGHQNYISSVSMTSDGEKIISSSGDKTIKVWSMLTGECLSTLEGHRADVMDSLVTAVGGWIISGSSDHTVKVWSLSTGECELTLRGHQGGVTCVSATADGDKIISGSLDGTVKVWNRATGKCLSTFESDQDHIRDVVISADDQKESSGNDPPLPLSLAPAKIITKSKIDQATALNDNAKGIDRLEYLAYAKALFSMLHRASPPICVGLFAKWGAGKSFMMHLLKQEFDPMSEEDPNTFEIIQWFDVRFTGNHRSTQVKETQNICWARCCRCLKVFSKWLGTDSSSFSSFTLAWGLLMKELFEEFYQDLMSISSGGYQPLSQRDLTSNADSNSFHFTDEGNENQTHSHSHSHSTSKTFRGFPLNRSSNPSVSPETADHDDDHDHDEEKGPTRTESFSKKSYVFVDFNAWEFNKSDQLWVGLIRNIYRTVERRLEVSQEVNDNGNSNGNSNGVAVDYKQLWRAERAKQEVIRSYGGIKALRLRILFLFFCFFLLFICMILALCYLTKLIHFFESHQGGGVVSVLTFLIFLIGTLYPIFEMIFRTEKETNTSRGESIYNEAADGRDKLGFLNHVRNELDELFQFLHKIYQQRTGISLTLVLFIDDLDRCVGEEGRIVSVLEALQLLLNIPGAPVIAFLAVDSRIIASSIETTLNKCVDLQDTPVTGWEYLDKIIQVPFCLPTPPPHKIQRILASALAGKDFALSVVAERLRDLMNQLQARQDTLNLSSIDSLSLSIRFLEEGESEGEGEGKGKEDELKQTRSLPISEFLSSLHSCKENDENLICQAAKSVLSKYVATVEERSRGLAKKERLELLCRSVNFCLYHFDFVFEVSSDQETSCSSPALASLAAPLSDKEDKKQERQPTEEEEKEKEVVEAEAEQEKKKIKVLNQYQSILSHISSSSRPPLVQPEVLTALNEISLYLEPNPRKLKRLANILQLVTEVANYKPISEANQTQKLSMVPKWSLFSLKIVKWIGLSECYPFRTSLLVYILEDIDLKQAYGVRNPTGLLHYEGVRSIDFENMTLVEFYYEFVSLLIRNFPQFKKLNRLDGDPELFISYLSLSMSGLPAENRVLLCSDILGPIIDKKKRVRDLNFSLLSHSYNLNSAMRNVIALEVQTSRRPLFPLSRRDNRRGERREGERRGGERRWDESEINERGMSERERWMEQNRQGRKR